MRRPILFIFFLLLITVVYAQQQVTITGKVIDNTGLGLPGVSILEKGTVSGTVTDIDGNYSLQASSNSTLVFSFMGFVSQEIFVGGQTTINVELAEANIGIDEVVHESNGIKILTTLKELKYVDGSVIDYVDMPMGKGFKVNNPQATKSCGCGSSFSVEDDVAGRTLTGGCGSCSK